MSGLGFDVTLTQPSIGGKMESPLRLGAASSLASRVQTLYVVPNASGGLTYMECNVVAISRSLGAMGEEVARSVAGSLGYRYVDDEILTQAAAAAGVSPQTIGQVERTPPLIARILASLATASVEPVYASPELMPMPDYASQEYRELIARVIADTAAQGKAVIVAHGASIPLAGMPSLLRVFITASAGGRASRLASEGGVNERDAKRAIENSDRERHEFFRRFYGLREELPTHYDLVVNTDVLSVEDAASVILRAAGR